jgi:hypothetical protein
VSDWTLSGQNAIPVSSTIAGRLIFSVTTAFKLVNLSFNDTKILSGCRKGHRTGCSVDAPRTRLSQSSGAKCGLLSQRGQPRMFIILQTCTLVGCLIQQMDYLLIKENSFPTPSQVGCSGPGRLPATGGLPHACSTSGKYPVNQTITSKCYRVRPT